MRTRNWSLSLIGGAFIPILLLCACAPREERTSFPPARSTPHNSQDATQKLRQAVQYYSHYHALAPANPLGLKRLAEACIALEEVEVQDSSCREAAECVAGGLGDRAPGGQERDDTPDSPGTVLWGAWLEQAATAEPERLVGQQLDNGWTFLGYDVNEDLLIRGEPEDLLLYWIGPVAASAGSEQDGWYRAGERWVQVLERAQSLLLNGGFELGVQDGSPARFPGDIYRADPDTRRLVDDTRAGRPTTVALLENNKVDNRTSFVSTWVPVNPDRLYLETGWIRCVGGRGYLGWLWAGDVPEGVRAYGYVAAGVRADDWQHYARLTQPLEGADRCQVLLLNYMAVGRVYFDNILLLEVGSPGE